MARPEFTGSLVMMIGSMNRNAVSRVMRIHTDGPISVLEDLSAHMKLPEEQCP